MGTVPKLRTLMMAIWVFLANTWSNMYVWLGVYVGVCLRVVSRYVPALFRRYMALDERDVAGYVSRHVSGYIGWGGVKHASLHEILTHHSWKQPYRMSGDYYPK